MNMSTNIESSDPGASRPIDSNDKGLRSDDDDEDAEDEDGLMSSELSARENGSGKCFILQYV